MRKLSIPLDNKVSKRYDIQGYGFYIESYPQGLVGFIMVDNKPETVRELTAQRIIRYPFKFASFFLSTATTHPGKTLELWIVEHDSEFHELPSETQYIYVTLTETDIAKETTQQDILNVLSSNIAKDSTLNSVNTNTLEIKNLLKPYVDYEVFTFTATAGSLAEQTFTFKLSSREIHVNVLQGKAKIRFASEGGITDFFTPTANVYKFKTTSLTVKEDNGTSDTIVEIVVFYDQVFTRRFLI